MIKLIDTFEGAELCYYINGESYAISLSNTQFAMIIKLLGLKVYDDGSIHCFSDKSLIKLMQMDSNPFKLKEQD